MKNSRLLLIETSHQSGFVALAEGNTLIGVRRFEEARRHVRDLAPSIHDLLTGATWQPRDIEAVIVSLGPGSYTGLRVGVMSAKTFAYATGCKLIGVETFAIIATQSSPSGRVAVIADAQQERIYVQEFENSDAFSPLRILPFQQWSYGVAVATKVAGPGLRRWASQLPSRVEPIDTLLWDPRPEALLQLGLERHRRAEWTDVWKVEPIYLRPSAAEEQLARKTTVSVT